MLRLLVVIAIVAAAVAQWEPNCAEDRSAITHLFEWKWSDIGAECERFLGPKGFCGVQISPPNENAVIYDHSQRPWWERYQPVSYKLNTRSGNEAQFIDMVKRCQAQGVRIYPDLVINHMVGAGQTGSGTGGCSFEATGTLSFPCVPYGNNDFHTKQQCGSNSGNIENYGDANQVRNCRLVGLVDLDHANSYVNGKISDFLNHLIDIGVAGFRVDAMKHMWPNQMEGLFGGLKNLRTDYYGAGKRPFIFQEVIDQGGGEAVTSREYMHIGRITEFNYGIYLGRTVRYDQMKNLKNFGEGWGYLMAGGSALVFVDNHDNQRGHGGGGNDIITYRESTLYKVANAFMLAWPYGFPRIMSSFAWEPKSSDWIGPPADGNWNIKDVSINGDGTCGNGWVCEHRWRQITNMVRFRNVAGATAMTNWWDNDGSAIAFSRGNKAFIAINRDSYTMSEWLQTGLPVGSYCDIISGDITEGGCTGDVITVNGDGRALITVDGSSLNPMVAFHVGGVGDATGTTSSPVGPTVPPCSDCTAPPSTGWQRTVIFLNKQIAFGEDMFLRGGLDIGQRPGCASNPSACEMPIRYSHVSYPSAGYEAYNAWSVGDNYLDWDGAESGQGSFLGTPAKGSPAVWTSNAATSAGYNELNQYGDHYWMLDVEMNCEMTADGWFEFKGILNDWETDVSQSATCTGTLGASKPFSSTNHVARCGAINVFTWGEAACRIDLFA